MLWKAALIFALFTALSGAPAKAEGIRAGDPVTTEGLVCDTASEAEAVTTLMHYGYTQEAALGAVNSGEQQRCVVGILSLGRYVREVSVFSLGSEHIAVQEVEILAIAPADKAVKLSQPLRQFVVTVKKLKSA